MADKRAGFTLIEGVIVVLIIVILAGVGYPQLIAIQDRAKLASTQSDVQNVEVAEEAYFADFGRYGTLAELQEAKSFSVSPGNTMVITITMDGYVVEASNASINAPINGSSATASANGLSAVNSALRVSVSRTH